MRGAWYKYTSTNATLPGNLFLAGRSCTDVSLLVDGLFFLSFSLVNGKSSSLV